MIGGRETIVSIPRADPRSGNGIHIATRRHVKNPCPKCPQDSLGRSRRLRSAFRVMMIYGGVMFWVVYHWTRVAFAISAPPTGWIQIHGLVFPLLVLLKLSAIRSLRVFFPNCHNKLRLKYPWEPMSGFQCSRKRANDMMVMGEGCL